MSTLILHFVFWPYLARFSIFSFISHFWLYFQIWDIRWVSILGPILIFCIIPYFHNRVYFGNIFFRMNRILTFRLVRVRRNSGLIKKESSEGSTDLLANIEKPTRILQTKNERTIMTASGSFVQKPPVLNLIKLTPTLSHLKL